MARKFIDIEVENEEAAIRGLQRAQEREERIAREMIEEAMVMGESLLRSFVPFRNGYIMRHIDRSGPTWMPGGLGGGGEWKGIVGIKQGSSRHPIYVEFGTGIYAGKGLIWPAGIRGLSGHYQNVMRFEKRGEGEGKGIFRYWTKGQRGQHYFYFTWRVLQAGMAAKLGRE